MLLSPRNLIWTALLGCIIESFFSTTWSNVLGPILAIICCWQVLALANLKLESDHRLAHTKTVLAALTSCAVGIFGLWTYGWHVTENILFAVFGLYGIQKAFQVRRAQHRKLANIHNMLQSKLIQMQAFELSAHKSPDIGPIGIQMDDKIRKAS
jgi:hypothetical protein